VVLSQQPSQISTPATVTSAEDDPRDPYTGRFVADGHLRKEVAGALAVLPASIISGPGIYHIGT